MAGIPVAFGAFAGGLWGGATSMMSLMTSFQQYQKNELELGLQRDMISKYQAAQQQQQQQQAAQDTAGQRDRERQGYGDQQPPAQPATTQPTGPVTTPAVTPAGTNVPTGGPGSNVRPPASTQTTTPAGVSPGESPTSPQRTSTPQQPQQPTAPIWNPNNPVGTSTLTPATAAPGPRVGGMPVPAPAPTTTDQTQPSTLDRERQAYGQGPGGLPVYTEGAPAPSLGQRIGQIGSYLGGVLTPSSGRGVQVPAGGPYGGSVYGPPTYQAPVVQPGGYFGQGAVGAGAGVLGQPTAPGGTQAAPQAPVIPPPQYRPVPPGAGGAPGMGGTPQAQAEPGGGGVLGAIGRAIIPSAAAAEPTPGLTLAATTSESAGQTAAAQPHPDASKPTTAPATQPVLPAQARPETYPDYKPMPAAVAPVAPDQKGPTVTTRPPASAPSVMQVDPRPWQIIQLKFPQLADQIRYAVDKYGGGQITYEQMAYVKVRESGYETDPNRIAQGKAGELGPGQVLPGTFLDSTHHQQSPIGEFDPHTMQGGLDQSAAVFRYLGIERGFGAGTVQLHYAYMRGEKAAVNAATNGLDAEARANPDGVALLRKMFNGGQLDTPNFPGRIFGGTDARTVAANLTQAGAAGPDGQLQTLSAYTPKGLGMDNAWRTAQSAFELYAMVKGNFSAVPMIENYFAGMAHQGTLSNLRSAYTAMAAGDMQTTAQYLAKAYAFFPDGVEGRIALDHSGKLWGQRFDSGTQQPMGQPFQITLNDIAAKMNEASTDPRQFLATHMNYLKEAAQIREINSHADYFEAMPQVREEMNQIRLQHQQEMEEAERQRLAIQQENADLRAQAAGRQQEQVRTIDTAVDKRYGPAGAEGGTLERPEGVDDRQWANQSEIARRLQYPQASGGGNLGSNSADVLANDIRSGHAQFQGLMGKDSLGRPVPYFAIWGQGKDPKTDQPDGEVSFETGRRFLGMAPGNKVSGANVGQGKGGEQPGIPLTPQPNPQRQAAVVGAGAGSPMVAMGGGFNLAGPVMNQQQTQPQPNAVS